MNSKLKRTSLYNEHHKLNAKILPFAGYEMPINYSEGIQFEYDAVRNTSGVFDVSHMGQIIVKGKKSLELLQYLTINDISILKNGDAQYSALCNNNGGIKDDVIIYKSKNKFTLIVNASNCDKIFKWMIENNKYNCTIIDNTDQFSLIAIQGPLSRKVLDNIFKDKNNLKFYKHKMFEIGGREVLLSRTGYTGELGFEILGEHNIIVDIWRKMIELGVAPCGLAVRDILRLEMKYCLYGNDINESTTPIEAGLSWILKINAKDFIGKKKLLNQRIHGVKRQLVCIEMIDKCIPRKGYDIYLNKDIIGEVSSGTFSLSMKKGIGMCYIDSEYYKKDLEVFLDIRGNLKKGMLSKSPFITKTTLHD